MSKTITIHIEPSEDKVRSRTISFEDLGVSEEYWKEMPEHKKKECLQEYIDMCEQPYWWVIGWDGKE